jgi:prepilin-type N-terminal cleavage/methylation domain-containing protein/prepilin-type processing-associated H-X9-DG protein
MRVRGRSAFTLPELLIVIAIIAILAALIGMSVANAFKASTATRCVANLHYLSQALSLRRSDSLNSRRPEMKVTHWPVQLLPYVDFKNDVLLCPAQGGTENVISQEGGQYVEDWDLGGLADWGTDPETIVEDVPHEPGDVAELAEVMVVAGHGTYYIPFEAGPYCLKLSNSQYQEARSRGYLGNADIANNIRSKYDCNYKQDGTANQYWLCFEDYGGDWDFKDVMVQVTDNEDGTFNLAIYSGHTGHTNSIVSRGDHQHLVSVPANTNNAQLSVGEIRENPDDETIVGGYESSENPYRMGTEQNNEQEGGAFVTSYGMNAQQMYLTDQSGRVAILDYSKYLARASDAWGDKAVDPNRDGVPIFARHGHRINVLFTDGAVRTVHPDEINPISPTNQILYWDP